MFFSLKSPQNYNKEPIQHHNLVLNRFIFYKKLNFYFVYPIGLFIIGICNAVNPSSLDIPAESIVARGTVATPIDAQPKFRFSHAIPASIRAIDLVGSPAGRFVRSATNTME